MSQPLDQEHTTSSHTRKSIPMGLIITIIVVFIAIIGAAVWIISMISQTVTEPIVNNNNDVIITDQMNTDQMNTAPSQEISPSNNAENNLGSDDLMVTDNLPSVEEIPGLDSSVMDPDQEVYSDQTAPVQ